jgi:hypothetical protein
MGVVDIEGIIALLRSQTQEVHLSIEDHGGEFTLPIFDARFLAEFPDLTLEEFVGLCHLSRLTEERVQKGALGKTTRQDWPACCEGRIKKDLDALKRLAAASSQVG